MLIRVGHEIAFNFPQPAAMVLMLYLHPSRSATIREPERLDVEPRIPISQYIDTYGNRCGRVFAPAGRVWCFATMRSSKIADCPTCRSGMRLQHNVQDLPERMSCYSCLPAATARWTAN